jgi:hypothetical protein
MSSPSTRRIDDDQLTVQLSAQRVARDIARRHPISTAA